ncbi:SGNH/GDSL hydrolase family protein [Alicyclobacillaceae bacterium I2511]|nr:SGNH/GDSL hydrolase family protein [Alicyclobacillaceae bacterium I2511]
MRIVCFGDSVTRGVTYVQGRLRIVKENYPKMLEQALHKLDVWWTPTPMPGISTQPGPVFPDSVTDVEVLNRGVFNDNSDGLLARLEKDVLAQHPDVVLIAIGGNDCNFHWDQVAHLPHELHQAIVPLSRYLTNLQSLVCEVRNRGSLPIVLDLPPLDPVRYYRTVNGQFGPAVSHWIAVCGGIEHWHGMYNLSLRKLMQTLQVPHIDVRTALKRAGDLADLISDDGIHPTAAGYRVMAETIAQQIAWWRHIGSGSQGTVSTAAAVQPSH